MNSKYNIYIPSKNRVNIGYTWDNLLKYSVNNFKIVVEPQDYNSYLNKFGAEHLLKLDKNNGGIGYARQFIKQYSTSNGEQYHWQIDDDVSPFYKRVNVEKKAGEIKKSTIICNPLDVLNGVASYVDKYVNIGQAGLKQSMYAWSSATDKSYNTVTYYQCVLNRNHNGVNYYNDTLEDLDFTMQYLLKGYVTVKFNWLNFDTAPPLSMEGGCVDAGHLTKRERLQQDFIKQWGSNFFTLQHANDPNKETKWKTKPKGFKIFTQQPILK